jgi:hypothetical protein
MPNRSDDERQKGGAAAALLEPGAEIHPQRIFEAYITQLRTNVDNVDHVLVVQLKYFAEDTLKTAERIADDPTLALNLVHSLSSQQGHEAVSLAERFALVFPETVTIADDA